MTTPRTAAEIREAFLAFFEARGHERLPSASLVPANDPTLLFTGAGMNQFKDEFLGRGRPGLTRATTAQKCLRVPDLENVGRTPRHHTFFEMLGNFSFGDYFKAETIPWEWEFFTGVLGLDGDRMLASVYRDDDEAFAIWREVVGLPAERIYRFGEKENFWPASAPSEGPNGPCGPCSELYYDLQPGGPLPDPDGLEELPGRFLEVGNFVFTQFDRRDGGELRPLPQRNIDVGLGLERIAAVVQGVPNNFETDLFVPLFRALRELGAPAYGDDPAADVRMRRIADHARAVFFCIADGAAPGREGRGYVVRKILRRAVRDGIDLGFERPFLVELLPAVQEVLAAAYPELRQHQGAIEALVQGEEERFRDVYRRGIGRLEAMLDELEQRGEKVFPGAFAFELHDTYGFPSDTSSVIVQEHGLDFDQAGFEAAMEEQRRRARAGSEIRGEVFAESLAGRLTEAGAEPTVFTGYDTLVGPARILALVSDGALVEALAPGEEGEAVLDRSPFYAEAGGQVGDRGRLLDRSGGLLAEVLDTRGEEGFHLHAVRAAAELRPGLEVEARVDEAARRGAERHHTATHLLHAALRAVLGDQVHQAGSKVEPERLRFDYTAAQAPTAEDLDRVEDRVAAAILAALPVGIRHTSLEQARAEGVTALFGEKYGDTVRVVAVAEVSQELCGGTHVRNTGEIGPFRILSDRALAAGVRRIEAAAGEAARRLERRERRLLADLAASLKTTPDQLPERIEALRRQLKEARSARKAAAPDPAALAAELAATGDGPAGATFAWRHLPGLDAAALRTLGDGLRRVGGLPAVVLLSGGDAERVPFLFL
ncbi:MAG: alanine--tRNA ligase, partial [Planctomycetota bacterium]